MRKTSLFAIFSLAFSLATTAQINIDTISPPATIIDTTVQNEDWVVRAPLSDEELEKREDNRARIARMKQRFRDFHEAEEQELKQAEEQAVDADFLWTDAQEGGQSKTAKSANKAATLPAEDDELRMEIGRNLQFGKSINSSPTEPVQPNVSESPDPLPETYGYTTEQQPDTNTDDIQTSIKSAFQPTEAITPSTTEAENGWQVEVASPDLSSQSKPYTFVDLVAGQSYLLEVSFAARQHDLLPESFANLNIWTDWLKQNSDLRLEVRAYTHNDIPQLDAIDLSLQRAQTIVDYWLAQGALQGQLSYRGYGSLSPLVPNTDSAAQQKNERIEVIILELPKH